MPFSSMSPFFVVCCVFFSSLSRRSSIGTFHGWYCLNYRIALFTISPVHTWNRLTNIIAMISQNARTINVNESVLCGREQVCSNFQMARSLIRRGHFLINQFSPLTVWPSSAEVEIDLGDPEIVQFNSSRVKAQWPNP